MHIDPSTARRRDLYQLLISVIVPRPIAWVGTRSGAGADNLAPFSFFTGVAAKPPTLAISVAKRRDGTDKDTATNILDTGVFTVSVVPSSLASEMIATSDELDPAASELAHAGLTTAPAERIDAPRPLESPVTLECRLVHHHDLGSTHLFVGEIVWITADDSVMDDGVANIERLAPLARLGGAQYATLSPPFTWIEPTADES